MAKDFYVRKRLYQELCEEAKSKGQTLTEYLDDLVLALALGDVVEP